MEVWRIRDMWNRRGIDVSVRRSQVYNIILRARKSLHDDALKYVNPESRTILTVSTNNH